MTPRASGRHRGANSPENAGTNVTPPESGTALALASTSAASLMIPRLSLSHATPAPAMAMLPSRANATAWSSPSRHAIVVHNPFCEKTGSPYPVFSSAKHPVPYVFFASPGVHRWPKVAACWSPIVAVIFTPANAPRWMMPNFSNSQLLTILGSALSGSFVAFAFTPKTFAHRFVSQLNVLKSISIVRDAFVTSVTKLFSRVKLHTSHVSIVPTRSVPFPAAARTASTCSTSHRILVPEKYVEIGRPFCARSASADPSAVTKSSQTRCVRVSSHTSALCSGFPVTESHATVVSRWFVMPTHATSSFAAPPGTFASA
mmetsp:Transcript_6839/g.23090  ORF Transcript_6839/g.23090 Transcript_6839/m.23090 type:complete len:316 (-) Transcript_6839:289-1236(-)